MAVLPDLDVVHAVLDVMPDAVLLVDEDGRVRFANAQVERVLGYHADSLIGRPIEELLPESARAAHVWHRGRYARHAVARPMGTGLPLIVRHASGLDMPVDISLGPLPAGSEHLVLVCVRDVSERARLLNVVRASEERYRHVVEGATDVFYQVTVSDDPVRGRLDYISPQCERVTGCSASEFVADSGLWLASIHPDDVDRVISMTRALLTEGVGGSRAYRIRNRRTGDYRWIDDRVAMRRDASGRTVGYLGTARDITPEVHAKEERDALERQLQHARKMEAVGRLAAGIAHDFNNLLTVVIGCADAARAGEVLPPGLRDELDTIADVARRGAGLTRQLLAFSRAKRGSSRRFEPGPHVVALEGLLRRTIPSNVSLSLTVAQDAWPVKIDPSQLDEVLVNLCVNARDAMPQGGHLALSLFNASVADRDRPGIPHGDYVAFTVSDTGTGIEPAVLPHVFEPFFTTKGGEKGTGLGLASVFGIAKGAGGGVYVDSAVGRGTMVTVLLPRHVGPLDTPPLATAATTQMGDGELVLVVDDDEDVRQVIARFLERSGYRALPVAGPMEALEACHAFGTDIRVLITDVSMPEMNGEELARRVAEQQPEIRILLASGYGAPETSAEGGGVRHLSKPFDREDLARAVGALLHRSS